MQTCINDGKKFYINPAVLAKLHALTPELLWTDDASDEPRFLCEVEM